MSRIRKRRSSKIIADNYTIIPRAVITYVGWLTKGSPLKQASSIVVEYADPVMANAVIYAGMAWDGQIHQCELYDGACRTMECFRYYHYEYFATQCNASQSCSYCAEQHETERCELKMLQGSIPKCTVCKGDHTAWGNACPARKKEIERVRLVKRNRRIYWHVPAKTSLVQTGTRNKVDIVTETNIDTDSDSDSDSDSSSDSDANQEIRTQVAPETALPQSLSDSQAFPINDIETAWLPNAPAGVRDVESLSEQDNEEAGNPIIDPQLQEGAQLVTSNQAATEDQSQLVEYPLEGLDEEMTTRVASNWLDNLWTREDEESGQPAALSPSAPTSTDPEGQNVEATALRKHLKRGREYARRNLVVRQELKGEGRFYTPAWTPRRRLTQDERAESE
ncbi:hypothetical protein ACMFMG_009481 [Clarireedia jacksonii]